MRTLYIALAIRTAAAVALTVAAPAAAQSPSAAQGEPWSNIDSMRASAGRPLHSYHSRHFELYTEQSGVAASRMLDSLEDAFTHATELLGMTPRDATTFTVFVTASRFRFPHLLSPKNKGVRTQLLDGRDVIVLVVNDSVRSYARHEVMHSVGFATWGSQRGFSPWLPEGLATFADGLCQGIPIAVVARDVLREQPTLTVQELTQRFRAIDSTNHAGAYVLAGSLIEFLWKTRGRDGVRRVWHGIDSLTNSRGAYWGAPDRSADVTRAWRTYVENVAGTRPGLSAAALQRYGCG